MDKKIIETNKEKIYKFDALFFECIYDLLECEKLYELENYTHHLHTNRLEHSLNVAYMAYKICKFFGLDYRSAARGGLLHDFYFYDSPKKGEACKIHLREHPKVAFYNASQYFNINDTEKDIILNHMYMPINTRPKTKEGRIVCLADKMSALNEVLGKSVEKRKLTKTKVARLAYTIIQDK